MGSIQASAGVTAQALHLEFAASHFTYFYYFLVKLEIVRKEKIEETAICI